MGAYWKNNFLTTYTQTKLAVPPKEINPVGGFFMSFSHQNLPRKPTKVERSKIMSNNFAIQRAIELVREEEYKKALYIFEEYSYSPQTPAEITFLALAESIVKNTYRSSVDRCVVALEQWPTNADIYLNLSTILLHAGRRDLAALKLERGLKYHPDHYGLKKLHRKIGVRRQPLLPFLSRNNKVNILAGKITSSARARLAA